MNYEQIKQNFTYLLNKANEKGVYNLEEANAAIQSLSELDKLIKHLTDSED